MRPGDLLATRDPVGDLGFDPATAGVAATILAVAALQTSWGTFDDGDLLDALGAWTADAGWHEPWRLLSSLWVHGSFDHLVGNVVSLLAFGWPLERAIGWRRWLLLYAAAGLAGALLAAVVQQPTLMVGASGAIFGLWGAMAALAVHPRQMLHGAEVAVLREALWPLGLSMVLQSLLPGIAWGAHLGGLLVGLVAGGTGLVVWGLERRAPTSRFEDIPPVRWGRAAASTLTVGVLACGCPGIALLLLVLYVAIVGIVAWAEPRWSAEDGWAVSLGSLAAAAALWGAGGLAFALGHPWAPEGSVRWAELGDGLPRVEVASRTAAPTEDGVRFGGEDDPFVVEVSWTEDPGWSFADRWTRLARELGPSPGVVIDDQGRCPSLAGPGGVVVEAPAANVRITSTSGGEPRVPRWEMSEPCLQLPAATRADAREILGDAEGAARLRHELRPDDALTTVRFLRFDLPCDQRVPRLDGLVRADPELAVEATRAALECPGPDVQRWIDDALRRHPDDGPGWLLRAELAEARGDAKGRARALREAARHADRGAPAR